MTTDDNVAKHELYSRQRKAAQEEGDQRIPAEDQQKEMDGRL